jgi:hypothetical protein
MKSTALRYVLVPTVLLVVASLLPYIAGAQTIQTLIGTISNILSLLIPMALSAALIAFFWGLVRFLYAGNEGNAESRTAGINIMVGGILALFVMVSVWGIVTLLQRSLGISSVTRVPAPGVCGSQGCGSTR